MPTVDIPQKFLDELNALTNQPLHLHEAPTPECNHWSLTQGEQQIACSCNPTNLARMVELINQISQVANPPQVSKPSPLSMPPRITQQPSTAPQIPHLTTGLSFSSAAREAMQNLNLSPEQIATTLNDPDEIHPAYQWRTLYRANGVDIIHTADTNTVLSVKKSAAENIQTTTSQPRMAGQKAELRENAPSDVNQMKERLIRYGFLLHHGGKHWKITHSKFPGVYASMPYTPSDNRWTMNLISEIRHKYGIDLRT